jgi:hypothetical protein
VNRHLELRHWPIREQRWRSWSSDGKGIYSDGVAQIFRRSCNGNSMSGLRVQTEPYGSPTNLTDCRLLCRSIKAGSHDMREAESEGSLMSSFSRPGRNRAGANLYVTCAPQNEVGHSWTSAHQGEQGGRLQCEGAVQDRRIYQDFR